MTTDAGPRLDAALASRVNWLRAGVLGANDGIVSIAGLVFGVAGATSDSMAVLIAGAAGMVAGALSMGGGEYVSVSAQRDTEQSAGVSADLRTSPWQAASASMAAFVLGALIPLLGVVFAPVPVRLPVTIAAVLLALAVTGFTSFVSHAGAPPYQVYTLPLGMAKAVFAGTSTIAFAIINAVKLVPYYALGQLNLENLEMAAVLSVPAVIAVFAGVWLVRVMPEKLFFRLVTWALMLISLKLIWDGAQGLI